MDFISTKVTDFVMLMIFGVHTHTQDGGEGEDAAYMNKRCANEPNEENWTRKTVMPIGLETVLSGLMT